MSLIIKILLILRGYFRDCTRIHPVIPTQPVALLNKLEQQTTEGDFLEFSCMHVTLVLCVSEHVTNIIVDYYLFLADNSMIYSQEPEMRHLMSHVAKKTPTKWFEVGIQLEIETSTLKVFEEKFRDPTRCYSEVFDEWKKEMKQPYTWYTMIDALEAVGERTLASDIREWLSGHTRT